LSDRYTTSPSSAKRPPMDNIRANGLRALGLSDSGNSLSVQPSSSASRGGAVPAKGGGGLTGGTLLPSVERGVAEVGGTTGGGVGGAAEAGRLPEGALLSDSTINWDSGVDGGVAVPVAGGLGAAGGLTPSPACGPEPPRVGERSSVITCGGWVGGASKARATGGS
jgi:hypothetical protein